MNGSRWLRATAILVAAVGLAACEATPTPTPTTFASPTPAPTAAPSAVPAPSATEALPSPTAEPTAAPTATAAPTPTPAPRSGDWPYRTDREIAQTLFPADGRVVLVEREWDGDRSVVVVLDREGHRVDGWPWSPESGSPIAVAALGPDDSLYVAARGASGASPGFTWALHRLTSEGREAEGFPVELPAVSYCGLQASQQATAYVTCETENEDGEVTGTVLLAIGADGATAARVAFAREATLIGFGPSGLPVVAIAGATQTVVRSLAADGTTRWSTAMIPGDARLDPHNGGIRVTRHRFEEDACGAPIRTTYDVVDAHGNRPDGWPVSVAGWASAPAVLDDGSMVVVTAGGRAIRYTRGGRVAAGWPERGLDVSFGCSDGTTPASDGARVVVVGGEHVSAIDARGRVLPGWPADPRGHNAIQCLGCTPGSGATVDPVLAGWTYVGTYDPGGRPRVAPIAANGSIARQVIVGPRGAELNWLALAPTGRVWAVSTDYADESMPGQLTLVAEGRIVTR